MSAMSLYSQPMPLQVNSSASERALFAANTYVPVNLNGGGYKRLYINRLHIFRNAILGASMHREWRYLFLSRSGVCVA